MKFFILKTDYTRLVLIFMNQEHVMGKLYTSNPAGIKLLEVDAEIWQITRGKTTLPDMISVKELSPSNHLFQRFLQEWKGNPGDEWWSIYEKEFLQELTTDEKLHGLRKIYKKLYQGQNIVLVCFCKDHNFCHRRLVGEFFKPYGIEAIELNPINNDQLSFF